MSIGLEALVLGHHRLVCRQMLALSLNQILYPLMCRDNCLYYPFGDWQGCFLPLCFCILRLKMWKCSMSVALSVWTSSSELTVSACCRYLSPSCVLLL